MKKTAIFAIVLVVMSSFVLAQGKGVHDLGTGIENTEMKEAAQGTGQDLGNGSAPIQTGMGPETKGNQTGPMIMQNKTMVHAGLANAMQNVRNENARAALQRNMQRFQEKYHERLNKMEDLEVDEVDEETGDIALKGKEPVRWFGFIKGKASKRFEISNGKVNEKAPWYDFLYSEESE